MKTLPALILILMIPAAAHADVCMKQKSHTDSYYYGGVTNPADDQQTETWMSSDKIASIGNTRTVIVDGAADVMYFVNHTDSTYVEIALPMDWSAVVDGPLLGRLNMFKRMGKVKATDETKKIGEWECRGYDVLTWIPYMDIRYDEREMKVWMATAPPADAAYYIETMPEFWTLRNYSDSLMVEMEKLKGLEVASEGVVYQRGFTVNSSEELLDMFEAEPPPDVYTVPEGYTKKEHLTIQDLRG
jgi:hypothetical protein